MDGGLCPYVAHAPLTLEGWQVWDLAMACQGQLRVAGMGGVVGFDLPAMLMAAEASGIDRAAVMALLPHVEAAMVAKISERGSDGDT